MARPVTEDPNTLAQIVTGLGGTVVPARTFQFDLPVSEVKNVIPKINELGLRVRKVSERVESHPRQALYSPMSVARLELYKSDEKPFAVPNW